MRIKVFRPQKYKLSIERTDDIVEHGYHPSVDEMRSLYVEGLPIFIDVELGDIIEVDGLQYFYAPSGIEVYEPIEHKTLEDYMGE